MGQFAIVRVVLENISGENWEIAQEEDAVTMVDSMSPTVGLEFNNVGRPTKIAVTVFAFGSMFDLKKAAIQRIIDDAIARAA